MSGKSERRQERASREMDKRMSQKEKAERGTHDESVIQTSSIITTLRVQCNAGERQMVW